MGHRDQDHTKGLLTTAALGLAAWTVATLADRGPEHGTLVHVLLGTSPFLPRSLRPQGATVRSSGWLARPGMRASPRVCLLLAAVCLGFLLLAAYPFGRLMVDHSLQSRRIEGLSNTLRQLEDGLDRLQSLASGGSPQEGRTWTEESQRVLLQIEALGQPHSGSSSAREWKEALGSLESLVMRAQASRPQGTAGRGARQGRVPWPATEIQDQLSILTALIQESSDQNHRGLREVWVLGLVGGTACGAGSVGWMALAWSRWRRLMQQRIEDAERLRWRSRLLDAASHPIIVCDLGNRIRFFNRGAQALYGWREEEAIGRVAYELLSTEFPIPRGEINRHLRASGTWTGTLIQTARDGRRLQIEAAWNLQRGKGEEPELVLEIGQDVTQAAAGRERVDVDLQHTTRRLEECEAERDRIRDALQKAYDQLRHTQDTVVRQERLGALGKMASGIAHDINNAISPVSLYTEALLASEPHLSDRARTYLGTIQVAIDNVAQTVARMREFCRQQPRQTELVAIELKPIVQEVLDLVRVRWNRSDTPTPRDIEVVLRLQPDMPEILGVDSEVRDALTNLLLNAADAMPEGGTVTVTTRHRPDPDDRGSPPTPVELEVADTGVGMDEATRRHCLEPFFTTKGERGTGLGLAMVFGMVQRHGASLDIDSAPGRGTTVRIAFQSHAGQPSSGPVRRPESQPASCPSLRLLVVDDDPLLLHSLGEALVADGHRVELAGGARQGVDLILAAQARGERFDLVLSDLHMPEVDGAQMASMVKANAPSTPVILLTDWAGQVDMKDLPVHADCVLSKPPRIPELRQRMALLCNPPTPDANASR